MPTKYSDAFKLEVVRDYYNSPLGVRSIALKYNLPSKNYINNWEKYLIKKGLLPPGSTKPNKTPGRTSETILRADDRTEREKRYEQEIRELKARIQYLESLESLKPFVKKKQHIRQMKYEAILELETQFPITLLTKIAGVSRSAYYRYKNKPKPITTKIEKLVIDIYRKSGKRKGYRPITDTLRNKYHLIVNKKKVLRIMQENNIQSVISKKCKPKVENATYKENILKRDFESDTPYKKLVTDITYIPTRRQMVYLCIIQDLFNNEPVAWTISDQQDKSLSVDTIKKLSRKCSLRGTLIHSDQGVHYTNKEYVTLLEKLSVTQSMSRKGNCWDRSLCRKLLWSFQERNDTPDETKARKPPRSD